VKKQKQYFWVKQLAKTEERVAIIS
jgi:hypothetical protein